MKRLGIKYTDKKLLCNLYKDELAVIRIQDEVEESKLNRGVRQVCTLSPVIFNAYIQEAIDMIKENTNLGININGQKNKYAAFCR